MTDDELLALGLSILIFAGVILLLFAPTIVAMKRGHHRRGWILFLNAFFGMSGIGWIALMFWATRPIEAQEESEDTNIIENLGDRAKETTTPPSKQERPWVVRGSAQGQLFRLIVLIILIFGGSLFYFLR